MENSNKLNNFFLELSGLEITKDKFNKYFGNYYASLSSIIKTTKPILIKSGLFFKHRLCVEKSCLITELMNDSEILAESSFPINTTQDPQRIGSAITYAKRYNIGCILNLNDTDDDDGNGSGSFTTATPEKKSINKPNNTMSQQRGATESSTNKNQTINPKEIIKFGQYKDQTIATAAQDKDFAAYCEYLLNAEDAKPDHKFKDANIKKWAALLDYAKSRKLVNDDLPF